MYTYRFELAFIIIGAARNKNILIQENKEKKLYFTTIDLSNSFNLSNKKYQSNTVNTKK
jgi:hypothetical protein